MQKIIIIIISHKGFIIVDGIYTALRVQNTSLCITIILINIGIRLVATCYVSELRGFILSHKRLYSDSCESNVRET